MLTVFALAHVLAYFAFVRTFALAGTAALLVTRIIFVLMPPGFVTVLLLSRKANNALTRVTYRIFMTWTGFFLYLFMASVLALLIPVRAVGIALFVGALLTAIGGLIQAATIRITAYDIKLRNLPDAWKGRTVAFISDIHLGQVYGAAFSRRIAARVMALEPDIILIGGDLYDGVAVDEKSVIAPLANFAAPLGTYFITGNHDQYGNESAYISAIKGVGITVLDDQAADIEGLQIVGVDYHDTVHADEYAAVLKSVGFDRNRPSILLKHVPSDLQVAANAGVALQLSGHTHRAQLFPMSFLTRRIYHGFDYGHKSFEEMQVVTSSGIGNWGPPMRVGSRSEIVKITLL